MVCRADGQAGHSGEGHEGLQGLSSGLGDNGVCRHPDSGDGAAAEAGSNDGRKRHDSATQRGHARQR